jgi:hypothetical protein
MKISRIRCISAFGFWCLFKISGAYAAVTITSVSRSVTAQSAEYSMNTFSGLVNYPAINDSKSSNNLAGSENQSATTPSYGSRPTGGASSLASAVSSSLISASSTSSGWGVTIVNSNSWATSGKGSSMLGVSFTLDAPTAYLLSGTLQHNDPLAPTTSGTDPLGSPMLYELGYASVRLVSGANVIATERVQNSTFNGSTLPFSFSGTLPAGTYELTFATSAATIVNAGRTLTTAVDGTLTLVPEPSVVGCLAFGLVVLSRRRK